MTWLMQYRTPDGVTLDARYGSRRDAMNALADTLFQTTLFLWDLGGTANEEFGDILMRHAVRLTAEAEAPGDCNDGYLLRLSQGRKWVVTPV